VVPLVLQVAPGARAVPQHLFTLAQQLQVLVEMAERVLLELEIKTRSLATADPTHHLVVE
jgi:hypothetical protein